MRKDILVVWTFPKGSKMLDLRLTRNSPQVPSKYRLLFLEPSSEPQEMCHSILLA